MGTKEVSGVMVSTAFGRVVTWLCHIHYRSILLHVNHSSVKTYQRSDVRCPDGN